jgi:hypothetical protein
MRTLEGLSPWNISATCEENGDERKGRNDIPLKSYDRPLPDTESERDKEKEATA